MIRFFFSLVMVLFAVQSFSVPVEAAVTCTGDFESVGGVCVPTATSTGLSDEDIPTLLMTIMNWLLGILGMIGILAFIISGLQYLTAAGDEKQAETAKRNIQYAIIGVVVALSGYVVVKTIDAVLQGDTSFF